MVLQYNIVDPSSDVLGLLLNFDFATFRFGNSH